MAWVKVGSKTIAGAPAAWGSGPSIPVSVDVLTFRDDVTNEAAVDLQFVVGPVSGGSSFGYNIQAYAWVVNDSTLQSQIIKNNSPSQWSSNLYGYLSFTSIGNVASDTSIQIAAQFASNSGRSPISFSDTVTIPRLATESGHVYVGAGGEWKKAVPYIGVNGEWKKAEAYIGVGVEWKKTV